MGSDAPFDLGVNDFIRMTIRNPVGDALTVDIDENDTQAQPFGTQAVLYGSSAMSPNVFRQSPITGQEFILDEAGSHTAIFTTAGTYDFEFSFRNEFLGTINAQNPDVWILIQESSDVVPEPATILVWSVLVTVGIFLRRRKRRPC